MTTAHASTPAPSPLYPHRIRGRPVSQATSASDRFSCNASSSAVHIRQRRKVQWLDLAQGKEIALMRGLLRFHHCCRLCKQQRRETPCLARAVRVCLLPIFRRHWRLSYARSGQPTKKPCASALSRVSGAFQAHRCDADGVSICICLRVLWPNQRRKQGRQASQGRIYRKRAQQGTRRRIV
jgi:hypothetical protein